MKLPFDFIIGNPPYQDHTSKAKNVKLWTKFCYCAFECLDTNGWIAFVTPSSVFSKIGEGGKIRSHLTEKLRLEVAEVHTTKMFDAGIETCHWVASTEAVGIEPPASDPLVDSIIAKMLDPKFSRLKLTAELQPVTRDELCADGKYEILFSGSKSSWTNAELKDTNRLKLVFPFSASYHKQFVTNKPLGMLNMCLHVDSEQEAEKIKKVTLSKLYRFFAKTYNRTSGFTPAVKNSMLPAVDFSKNWADEELYALFGITDEERLIVEQ